MVTHKQGVTWKGYSIVGNDKHTLEIPEYAKYLINFK